MKINKNKSGIMYITLKNDIRSGQRQHILGFPIVKEYKYLGIWFDNRLSFDRQYEERKKKVEKGIKIVNILK